MDKILREENGVYQIDCSCSLLATDQLYTLFHTTTHSLLNDADFIIETQDLILIVEYKNANIPGASHPELFSPSDDKYVNRIARKYYDSILPLLAKRVRKPYLYVYILEYPLGDSVTRRMIRNKIKEKLPFRLQDSLGVGKMLISDFQVLSIEEWNTTAPFCDLPISPITVE